LRVIQRYVTEYLAHSASIKLEDATIETMCKAHITLAMRKNDPQESARHIPKGRSINVIALEIGHHPRAYSRLGDDLQIAIAALRGGLEQRDAQPHMSRCARSKERIRDTLQRLRVHTPTIIADADGQPVAGRILDDLNLDPACSGLKRVLHEIQQMER